MRILEAAEAVKYVDAVALQLRADDLPLVMDDLAVAGQQLRNGDHRGGASTP